MQIVVKLFASLLMMSCAVEAAKCEKTCGFRQQCKGASFIAPHYCPDPLSIKPPEQKPWCPEVL
jgi:hypothetical protein